MVAIALNNAGCMDQIVLLYAPNYFTGSRDWDAVVGSLVCVVVLARLFAVTARLFVCAVSELAVFAARGGWRGSDQQPQPVRAFPSVPSLTVVFQRVFHHHHDLAARVHWRSGLESRRLLCWLHRVRVWLCVCRFCLCGISPYCVQVQFRDATHELAFTLQSGHNILRCVGRVLASQYRHNKGSEHNGRAKEPWLLLFGVVV